MYRLPQGELDGKEVVTTKNKFETIEKYILENPRLFNVNLTELIIHDQITFQFTELMSKLLESLPNLVILGAVKCKIKFIERFPNIPSLKVLILDHNMLDNETLLKLVPYRFTALSLMDNNLVIEDEQELLEKNLSSIFQMKQLEILNLVLNSGMCEVRKISVIMKLTTKQYRKYQRVVFQNLPSLRYLDNYQRDGVKFISKEVTRITGWTSKEESKELAVVNPSEESDKEQKNDVQEEDLHPNVSEKDSLISKVFHFSPQ